MASYTCIQSISSLLASPYSSWGIIASFIAVAVLSILAIIYSIATMVGRPSLRIWVKVKMYDTLMSLVLIIIFSAFSTTLCSVDAASSLNAITLLPTQSCGVGTVSSLYSVALCDMYTFNQLTVSTMTVGYLTSLIFALPPTIDIKYQPLKSSVGTGKVFLQAKVTFAASLIDKFVNFGYKIYAVLFLVNQLQVLLLAASPLLFALLISIGLVSRVFGVTRTFGGTLIALGLAIGFVYPLITAITYGFIDTNTMGLNFLANPVSLVWTVIALIVLVGLAYFLGPLGLVLDAGAALAAIGPLIFSLAMVSIGLLIVPMLNFTIVNTFMVDFSKTIGEHMDFFSLFTNLV